MAYNSRSQQKRDTYANWLIASTAEKPFIPLDGELIIFTTNEQGATCSIIKVGNGINTPIDLPTANLIPITWTIIE